MGSNVSCRECNQKYNSKDPYVKLNCSHHLCLLCGAQRLETCKAQLNYENVISCKVCRVRTVLDAKTMEQIEGIEWEEQDQESQEEESQQQDEGEEQSEEQQEESEEEVQADSEEQEEQENEDQEEQEEGEQDEQQEEDLSQSQQPDQQSEHDEQSEEESSQLIRARDPPVRTGIRERQLKGDIFFRQLKRLNFSDQIMSILSAEGIDSIDLLRECSQENLRFVGIHLGDVIRLKKL